MKDGWGVFDHGVDAHGSGFIQDHMLGVVAQ